MSKGRNVPPAPGSIAALVRSDEPLTREALRAAIEHAIAARPVYAPIIATPERLPEPSPFERGALDRYQDRSRKR